MIDCLLYLHSAGGGLGMALSLIAMTIGRRLECATAFFRRFSSHPTKSPCVMRHFRGRTDAIAISPIRHLSETKRATGCPATYVDVSALPNVVCPPFSEGLTLGVLGICELVLMPKSKLRYDFYESHSHELCNPRKQALSDNPCSAVESC